MHYPTIKISDPPRRSEEVHQTHPMIVTLAVGDLIAQVQSDSSLIPSMVALLLRVFAF